MHDGRPVRRAYVRLLDRTGEFTAEVPTGASGDFRFFAAPGRVDGAGPRGARVAGRVHGHAPRVGAVTEVELTSDLPDQRPALLAPPAVRVYVRRDGSARYG